MIVGLNPCLPPMTHSLLTLVMGHWVWKRAVAACVLNTKRPGDRRAVVIGKGIYRRLITHGCGNDLLSGAKLLI